MEIKRFSCDFLFFLIFHYNFIYSFKLLENFENKYEFEKSVAHILTKEINETSNKFLILFHSLNEKDEQLNSLVRILNNENIALILYSQLLPQNR